MDGIQHQDITFISDVYSSIARGDGIEPAIAAYTRNFPDVRFSWQAMCHKTSTYFAYTPYNFDADVERDYMEVNHLNGMPAMTAHFPVSRVVKSEYFLTTRDYERTDIYNLFFRPRDELNASAGLWAYREGDNAALLTVDIPKRIGPSERLALEQSLATILPHLQNSFALMMELDIKRKRTAPMDFWLETLPSAAFCVSANGCVNDMNAPARKLVESTAGLAVLRSRRLTYGSDEQRRAIEPRLRKALVTLQPDGPFPIPAPGGHRLAGFCVPLSYRDQRDAILDFFRNGQRDVLLVVTDSGDLPPTPATFLSRTL